MRIDFPVASQTWTSDVNDGRKCAVARGRGYSVVNGKRPYCGGAGYLRRPLMGLHGHVNLSDTADACLFCLNGLPVTHSLGLYLEEALQDHGGYQTFDAPSVGSAP